MASFKVYGPYKVQYEKRKGGRHLCYGEFWQEGGEPSALGKETGCYVFAIQNRGLTPIYVGRATKNFLQETFNASNRHKYQNGFSAYAKGSPMMFFVVHARQKGPKNVKHISAIEDFLIQAGVAKNPELQNVHGAQTPKWSIEGVIRSGKKKRSNAEHEFRRLFDIN